MERAVDHARLAPLDVRPVSGEMRSKDEHGIARVKKRLTKKLLEHFGPGSDHHVVGRHIDMEFAPVVGSYRFPKRGQTERRTVVCDMLLNGFGPGAKRAP